MFGVFAMVLLFSKEVSTRWIVVRNGLFICSSKDQYRFVHWKSISQIDTHCGQQQSRISLVTDTGIEVLQTAIFDMLPFVNKLLDMFPDNMERVSLLNLQQELRKQILYNKDVLHTFGLLASIPIFVVLNWLFPVKDVGFVIWGVIMGAVSMLVFGLYVWIRNHLKHKRKQHVNLLMEKLEQNDYCQKIILANRSMSNSFGDPPRTVTKKVRRMLLVSGEIVTFVIIFTFCFSFISAAIWISDRAEIRAGFLPFRWQPVGEGKIVAIADSSTETAPNGSPAPGGRDVITVERVLPDGRIIQCRNPSWPKHGNFQVGQTVSLLQYPDDETSLRIDAPIFQCEVRRNIFMIIFFGTVFVLTSCSCLCAIIYNRKISIRLIETAQVKRYRIRSQDRKVKVVTKELVPIDGDGEPINLKLNYGLIGDSVSVFFNELKPNESLVAESLSFPISFDPTTGKIDCKSDRLYWIVISVTIFMMLALTTGLLRIFLLY
ncbi:MAG: hypothetical protein LBK06_07330 [Planctomycetaceae bacterium]|jgi:hypothetical protein|nr:hypothetical protein [Planctomycetaceae bacterium]